MMSNIENQKGLFDEIATLIEQARKRVATTINQEMIFLYWNIGRTIKKEIMKSERAEYGKQIIQSLSGKLTQKYGRGYSEQNLWHMIKFHEIYPILSAVQREFQKLSWTHIKTLIYIEDELKREFYGVLCQKEQWSTRTLQDRIDLLFYHRKMKCFVVIDLKLDKFRPEYKGQMELYLRYMEKYEMLEGENPPVGLILCSEKGKEVIELLFLPNDKIKVAEYMTNLPPKELFAEKLHKAIEVAQLKLEEKNE